MNFRKCPGILPLLCALLCLAPLGAKGSDLPVDHWAYDYLDRLKVKGLLKNFLNQTRPIPRTEVARAIWQVTRAVEGDDPRITGVERSQLEWLQMEFAEELQDYTPSVMRQERHLFSWSDENKGLVLDVAGKGQGHLGRFRRTDRCLLDIRATIQARGFFGESLTYAATVVKGQVNSNFEQLSKEDVGLTGYFDSRGSYAYYDWSHAQVNVKLHGLELQLGRQPISWGPGARGNLALSDYPPAYDFFQIRASVRQVRFIHLHGFLLPEVKTEYQTPQGFIRSEYPNKFVAAHRLEIQIFSRVDLGLTEAIIYGERGLDLAYLNPLVFFWSAQHSSHDRDNEILSADLRVRPIQGLSLYGAVFIDELYLKKLFAQDARNKAAFQGGLCLVDPLGLADTDLRLEYTRVQPCVYTHKFPVNTYRHDGVVLGHWLEQNGDDLFLAVRHRFSRSLRLSTQLARTRQGEKGEMPWCHAEPWRYSFLDGIVDRTQTLGLSLDYEPIHNLRASLSYERTERRNKDLQAGDDETLNQFSLALSFDY